MKDRGMTHLKAGAMAGLVLGGLAVPGAAAAQSADAGLDPAAAFAACRAISEPERRLGCYDSAAQAFETARAAGQVVVLNRAEVAESQRRAFGLGLNVFNPFAREGGLDEIESIEGALASARPGTAPGRWIFTLNDGTVWEQTESLPRPIRPSQGAVVRIRRAALGSYLMNLEGVGPAIRVRRR